MAELGLEEPGLKPRDPRWLRPAEPGVDLLHRWGERSARMDHPGRGDQPQAAGKIHTDFEKGFIRAQTIAYEDFIAYKDLNRARKKPVKCALKVKTTSSKMAM